MKLAEPVRDLLNTAALGHLATLNPDGSPQVSVVWVGVDGEQNVAAHLHPQQKALAAPVRPDFWTLRCVYDT